MPNPLLGRMVVQPLALKVVAALFIVSGVFAAIDVATDLLFRSRLNLNFGVLNLWIGRWLFAHEWRGHRWACIVIQIHLVIIPVVSLLMLLGTTSPELRLFGIFIGRASPVAVLVFSAALCALQVWQYRVLSRADVRALFPEPG